MISATDRLINPFLFNRLQHGGLPATLKCDEQGRWHAVPVIDGKPRENLDIVLESEPADKRDGRIRMTTRTIGFVEQADLEREAAEEAERERIRAAKKAEQQQREAERRESNREFNESLRIPVPWELGYNFRLSGLLAGSDGTGLNRASVSHVLLRAPLNIGRIRRVAGDFLCKSTSTAALGTRHGYGDGNSLDVMRLKCKACLRIAERLRALSPQ